MNKLGIIIGVLCVCYSCRIRDASGYLNYKNTSQGLLEMHVYYPEAYNHSEKLTGIVLFFGGGWVTGSPEQFARQARYFADKGAVCFIPDYRTEARHGTTPFEALKDAKSAMRFVRDNAEQFHIDPQKIVAAGGSAGGHLAAATAMISDFNDPADDLRIDATPNAMVLFAPVIDNGPSGYAYERIQEHYQKFSPIHNLKSGLPPTLLIAGTKDRFTPKKTYQKFCGKMREAGNQCELMLYQGKRHAFFMPGNGDEYFYQTLAASVDFLTSLGFLDTEKES